MSYQCLLDRYLLELVMVVVVVQLNNVMNQNHNLTMMPLVYYYDDDLNVMIAVDQLCMNLIVDITDPSLLLTSRDNYQLVLVVYVVYNQLFQQLMNQQCDQQLYYFFQFDKNYCEIHVMIQMFHCFYQLHYFQRLRHHQLRCRLHQLRRRQHRLDR